MKTTVIFVALCITLVHCAVFQSQIFSNRRQQRVGNNYGRFQRLQRNRLNGHVRTTVVQQSVMDYFVNITVGTPPQSFTMKLDTTSADMWVIDSKCYSDNCMGPDDSGYEKHRFHASQSSTFIKDGRDFNIEYARLGSCSGYLGIDTVAFSGLVAKNQTLGVATDLDDSFGMMEGDGVIGYGWPDLSLYASQPPIQNILSQLDQPLFQIWIDLPEDETYGGAAGLITYGAVDYVQCESKITYAPLSSRTYWQFRLDGFSVGTYSVQKSQQAMTTTVYEWIAGPTSYIEQIAAQIGATYDSLFESYFMPCDAIDSASSVVFKIAGVDFTLLPKDYTAMEYFGPGCLVKFEPKDVGGFGASWEFGDAFMRKFCTVHDVGNSQLGFSLARHSSSK